MTSEYAVATNGLSKRYGRDVALDQVDVRVPDGAVYALVGANGSGKSTLIRLLMNLESPDGGTADVLGIDPFTRGPEVRAQIGYVPEHHQHGNRWMTCARLLRHLAAYYTAWDRAYADQLAHSLELSLDKRVMNLSKGEARRLHLVMAMAHRPALLLLDEATDGLDAIVRKRVLTILAEHLADTPTTVLIATHRLHEVESLADHIGIMHKSRLVTQISRDDLKRTVRRYRIELPEGWVAPVDLAIHAKERARREVQWTLVGEEEAVVARLVGSGAQVHDVQSVGLEDAALALLPGDSAL